MKFILRKDIAYVTAFRFLVPFEWENNFALLMPPPSQLGEAVIASSLQGRASGFNDSVLTGASRERYVWHVSNQRQLRFLKHHKTKVQWCRFSPVPERLTRGAPHSPSPAPH
ncbi:hypothetical protein RR46_06346 [Papilio xuthus]|uniref:Uncharacterized protein n=1 Tax=Papilio xuthus TaxID=66420 RepID=A0A194QCB7_PAPXU|nr:hypothetical protein RR46_06346 [Papilio xuthus]